jgi:predicted SAM-dependent methyltransferase
MNATKGSLFSRPLTSYSKVMAIVSRWRRGKQAQINRGDLPSRKFLDIGCGPNGGKDFVNLDYDWKPGVDVIWDITQGLPFEAGRFEGIYTEHCLEHIPLEATDRLLAHCFRILKPGGVLRVIVPDGEIFIDGYRESTNNGNSRTLPYADHHAYQGIYTPIMTVNRIFREHGHLFIYDFCTMRQLMERNGFESVKKEVFRNGRRTTLLRDSEHREHESLYVEASKPAAA